MAVTRFLSFDAGKRPIPESHLSIQSRLIEYGDGQSLFEGMLVWDDALSGPRPGVLVAHTIRGRTAFEEGKARDLAAMGYVGFAHDVYGKSEIGSDDAVSRSNMNALISNRIELQRRLSLSLSTMLQQPEVDAARAAAIGFCFGGLGVLDLARIGAPVAAVISFHGLFSAPGNTVGNKIDASVLALHGWDDPLATPDTVLALGEELSAMGADWQIHGYGGTQHAFTNPAANDVARGTLYDAAADKRSWLAMTNLLAEKFE
jgi:dienelactone hydrolase